jgi:NADH-quinone oxidoreductase subunit M
MMTPPLLSILIWLPILAGGVLLSLNQERTLVFARSLALGVAVLCFGFSIVLFNQFDPQSFEMQWVEQIPWIPTLGIHYALGIDGFSLPLIMLTCFMTPLIILASGSVKNNTTHYLAAFLFIQGLIVGALTALDAMLFYIFWEAMLIPMFLMIGIWGGQNRMYATLKFFLYTFLGSVLLLVALIYLHIKARTMGIPLQESFNIQIFHQLPLNLETQKWLFIAFFLAFAVKIPMWPIHTWLPDAHVEAPTGGSVILAAVLLKMGGYGFLRFLLPILPDASAQFSGPIVILSLIAITYIGLVSIVQNDMKKLIAYSSISHMGFVTLGFFMVYAIMTNSADSHSAARGIEGAMVQMISHGFVSAALFLCVGVLYDRMHSRLIHDYGGVVNRMPIFASFFMLFSMANIGLPGTSGFVGEFLIIVSAFKAQFWYAVIASSILILGASYTLWMYKRVVFGSIKGENVAALQDLKMTEIGVFVVLAAAILGLGLRPAPLLNVLQTSSYHLVQQMLHSKMVPAQGRAFVQGM